MMPSAMRWLMGLCLGLVCALPGHAAEDPYAAWHAGRPGEAIPTLRAKAEAVDTWQAWYDLGLCAAAAEDHGLAAAALVAAQRRAPWRSEPRQVLSLLGQRLPPSAVAWLGPLAWPGLGWPGLILAACAGICLAAGFVWPRRRFLLLSSGGLALLLILPGTLAAWREAQITLLAIPHDTSLLDATGRVVGAIEAGTVVRQISPQAWQDRYLVDLGDGVRGYVPTADTARY